MINEPLNNTTLYDLQAGFFKTLSHPVRLAILNLLRDGEHCVCHLEAHLGLRQAYISQQLAVLREAKIIDDHRDGWNIFYRVIDARVFDILNAIGSINGDQAEESIDKNSKCTCPHCSGKIKPQEKSNDQN